MSEIFLVRHGETEWNADGRFQGRLNSSLTALGRDQAVRLGRILSRALDQRPIPSFHVSPLGRTRDTAALIVQQMPEMPAMVLEPRLQEVSIGAWEGLTLEDIEAEWPSALDGANHFDWYFRSPDGETLEAALKRVRSWLDDLDGPVIAVSHGLFGRLIRGSWLGLDTWDMLRLPVPHEVAWHLTSDGARPLGA